MSFYAEEVVGAIDKLDEFCRRILVRFDNQTPAWDLLSDIGDLEARLKDLLSSLPEGVSLGSWSAKIHWLRYWLGQNLPAACKGDLEWIADEILPSARRSLQNWAVGLKNFDEELRSKVAHLVRIRDFSSAIRAAFVVLTERLRTKYGLPTGIDGPDLVNKIFGTKSLLTPHLSDDERQPIRNYLSGAYGVLRNKYMHNDPPLNLAELEAALAMVNLALTLIEPPPP